MKRFILLTVFTLFLFTISFSQEKKLNNCLSLAMSFHPGELDYKITSSILDEEYDNWYNIYEFARSSETPSKFMVYAEFRYRRIIKFLGIGASVGLSIPGGDNEYYNDGESIYDEDEFLTIQYFGIPLKVEISSHITKLKYVNPYFAVFMGTDLTYLNIVEERREAFALSERVEFDESAFKANLAFGFKAGIEIFVFKNKFSVNPNFSFQNSNLLFEYIYKRNDQNWDVEMLFQKFGFNVTLSVYR